VVNELEEGEESVKHGVAIVVAAVVAANAAADTQLVDVSADYTYASRYVAHGFNIGDTPAHQPSFSISSGKLPGFNFTFWSSLTVDRDEKGSDELDYMFVYNRTFMKDDPWAIALSAYFDYWVYPNISVDTDRDGNPISDPSDLQGQKYHLGASLPSVVPMPEGFSLSPGYNHYFWTPVKDDQFDSGSVHELVLSGSAPLPLPEATAVPQSVNWKATMNYHTGFLGVDSGWSHATAHISTSAPICGSLAWHASLDYQWTFEETLNGNKDDVAWGTVGVGASF
jgi:hypothetical protein